MSMELEDIQIEFKNRLIEETGLGEVQSSALALQLGLLSAKHFKLALIGLERGLNKEQERAHEDIEHEISMATKDIMGIKGARFVYDPRGITVGLEFDSGACNSFTGTWKVPFSEAQLNSLTDGFWKDDIDLSMPRKMQSLPGATMQLNALSCMVEVMKPDGEIVAFESVAAIKEWVRENNISVADAYCMYELDAKAMGEKGVGVDAMSSLAEMKNGDCLVIHLFDTENLSFSNRHRDYEIAKTLEDIGLRLGDSAVNLRHISGRFSERVKTGTLYFSNDSPKIDHAKEGEALLVINIPKVENGCLVKLNPLVRNHYCPEGREDNITAVARPVLHDRGVHLDRDLHGCKYWYETDLVPVSKVERILFEAAEKIKNGDRFFDIHDSGGNLIGKFECRMGPSQGMEGKIDMRAALRAGCVYLGENALPGIDDCYRYVVIAPDFDVSDVPEGDAWVVNEKGEIAPGYEEPQPIGVTLFRDLNVDEKSDLRAVVERRFSNESPELG